jgi:3-oxoadipate enol-lactonase
VPSASLNGIDFYFERAGAGNRLLFLNGSGSALAQTGPLVDVFRARLDVVAHDQRGLGRSARPPGPYTMAQYAADALALLDHVGWASCRVVGVSFGGMVAQELAVTAPGRVERLALMCTSPGGAGGSSYPLHELADLGAAERAARSVRLLDTRFTDGWLASHPADRAFVDMLAQRHLAEKSADERRGEAEQLGARRHHDVWDRLGAVTAPTLVAAGRYDGIAPLENAEAIAKAVTGADLRVYEGGHCFFAQDGAAFPDILAFLDA